MYRLPPFPEWIMPSISQSQQYHLHISFACSLSLSLLPLSKQHRFASMWHNDNYIYTDELCACVFAWTQWKLHLFPAPVVILCVWYNFSVFWPKPVFEFSLVYLHLRGDTEQMVPMVFRLFIFALTLVSHTVSWSLSIIPTNRNSDQSKLNNQHRKKRTQNETKIRILFVDCFHCKETSMRYNYNVHLRWYSFSFILSFFFFLPFFWYFCNILCPNNKWEKMMSEYEIRRPFSYTTVWAFLRASWNRIWLLLFLCSNEQFMYQSIVRFELNGRAPTFALWHNKNGNSHNNQFVIRHFGHRSGREWKRVKEKKQNCQKIRRTPKQ